MMDCQKIKELLTTREDASTFPEVLSHAAECPVCASLLRAEDQMNRGFRALSSVPFRADLTGPVLRKIKEGTAGSGPTGTSAGVLSPKLLVVGGVIVGIITLFGLLAISGEKRDLGVKPSGTPTSGTSFPGSHAPSGSISQHLTGIASSGNHLSAGSAFHPGQIHPAASHSEILRPTFPPSGSLSAPVTLPGQPPANE